MCDRKRQSSAVVKRLCGGILHSPKLTWHDVDNRCRSLLPKNSNLFVLSNSCSVVSQRHQCHHINRSQWSSTYTRLHAVAVDVLVGGVKTGDQLLTGRQSHSRLRGFHLSRRQWSLLNRFRTGQGHCMRHMSKEMGSDRQLNVSVCGDIQTMSHIVDSCPLTKLGGNLQRVHTPYEAIVDWLTSYGT